MEDKSTAIQLILGITVDVTGLVIFDLKVWGVTLIFLLGSKITLFIMWIANNSIKTGNHPINNN